jgi:hypothetical protein
MVGFQFKTSEILDGPRFPCEQLGQELAACYLPRTLIIAIIFIPIVLLIIIVKHPPPLALLLPRWDGTGYHLSSFPLACDRILRQVSELARFCGFGVCLRASSEPRGVFEVRVTACGHDFVVRSIRVEEPILARGHDVVSPLKMARATDVELYTLPGKRTSV